MNFPVKIGAHKDGFGVIGAEAIRSYGDSITDTERVYGIQIPHRVIAQTENGPRIMTPTEAKKRKLIFKRFPTY